MSDLCFIPARRLAHLIRSKQVSAREVMRAHLEQIGRVNPILNAVVAKLPDEDCLALADAADASLSRGEDVGALHGLPTAFKDAEPAVGFPFTRGSLIFKDDRPSSDSVLVERIRKAGAIPIGKTNISEFTMGSHTYNRVYGTTVNPYDPTRSAGGSSGGAAAAVASGMLPIADGSDLGGSLRNPANFNNLVALRPTVGLVPNAPTAFPLIEFLAKGALARTVDDVAFFMGIVSGEDARDPRTWASDPLQFAGMLERDFRGTRIAWCPDLGGLPLDPRVRNAIEPCRPVFERLGCQVEDVAPDLRMADDVFLTLRAWMSAATLGPLLDVHRSLMKPEAVWQIELGRSLTNAQVAQALQAHTQLLEQMRCFHESFDFFVCAVNQTVPFVATLDWPHDIAGVSMDHYIAWMKSTYWVSTILAPALSVPAGFTDDGLPVGIQLVGRPRADWPVLQLGQAFEAETRMGLRRPPLVTSL